MLSELLKMIASIGDKPVVDFVDMARKLAFIKKPQERSVWSVYLQALLRYALAITIAPMVLLAIGIATDWNWLIGIVGVFWSICTILIFVIAAPVGVLIEMIADYPSGFGKNYVHTVGKVLAMETAFAFGAMIVPVGNNPNILPVAIVAVILLAWFSWSGSQVIKGKKPNKLATKLVGSVLTITILAFFFPNILPVGSSWIRWANEKVLDLKKPGLPLAPLATSQAELNQAIAQAQQTQSPMPPGMQANVSAQPIQPADIRFAGNETSKDVPYTTARCTPWVYLPRTTGSWSTDLTPALTTPGQSISIYCLDGRKFTRTYDHNPVIYPTPQAISIVGDNCEGTATINILRLGHGQVAMLSH